MSDKILVSKDRLIELIHAELALEALEAAGVDSWEGVDMVDPVGDHEIQFELKVLEAKQ